MTSLLSLRPGGIDFRGKCILPVSDVRDLWTRRNRLTIPLAIFLCGKKAYLWRGGDDSDGSRGFNDHTFVFVV